MTNSLTLPTSPALRPTSRPTRPNRAPSHLEASPPPSPRLDAMDRERPAYVVTRTSGGDLMFAPAHAHVPHERQPAPPIF